MSCNSNDLSFNGINALGGLLNGGGCSNMGPIISSSLSATGAIPNALAAISAVAGAINDSRTNDLVEASSAVANTIPTAGASQGNGFATGAIGSAYSISGTTFIDALSTHTTAIFGSNQQQMAQVFNTAETFSNLTKSIAFPLAEGKGSKFGRDPASLSKVKPDEFENYLGSSITGFDGTLSNGFDIFVNNNSDLAVFGSDIVNLGVVFDFQDVVNFGNPGQIINAIYTVGAEHVSGVDAALKAAGVVYSNVTQLVNSIYNETLSEVLQSITKKQQIADTQKMLGTNIPSMTSLNDYTNIEKILPNSYQLVTFDTFAGFKQLLISVELGKIKTPVQFGTLLSNTVFTEIPTIENNTQIIDNTSNSQITSKFLGGTGENGYITVVDLIGSIGGVIIKPAADAYISIMTQLNSAGSLDTLKAIYAEIIAGVNGDYLDDPDPLIATKITDPRSSTDFTDLDDFIIAKAGQINSEAASLVSAGADAITEWQIMQQKISDEIAFAAKTDLQLSNRNNANENAFYFTDAAKERILDTGTAPVIDGMADAAVLSGDRFGEYWRAYNAENRNRANVEDFEVRWRAACAPE